MARYKVIRNGIIENIVEWDGVTPWAAPAGTTVALALASDAIYVPPAPTDDEILAAEASARSDREPTALAGRKAIFEAADIAAQRYAGLKALDTEIQLTGNAKQKTGSTALVDKAYQKAKRLAAAYADAVND